MTNANVPDHNGRPNGERDEGERVEVKAPRCHCRIRLRGDCGEPVEDTRDLFGSTVQRAARVCDAASGDQILVSDAVREECHADSSFADYGCRHLKGFRYPVQVFECDWHADSAT